MNCIFYFLKLACFFTISFISILNQCNKEEIGKQDNMALRANTLILNILPISHNLIVIFCLGPPHRKTVFEISCCARSSQSCPLFQAGSLKASSSPWLKLTAASAAATITAYNQEVCVVVALTV